MRAHGDHPRAVMTAGGACTSSIRTPWPHWGAASLPCTGQPWCTHTHTYTRTHAHGRGLRNEQYGQHPTTSTACLGVDEHHVVPRRALADAAGREPNASGGQPLHRRLQVVDPQADVVQGGHVHPGGLGVCTVGGRKRYHTCTGNSQRRHGVLARSPRPEGRPAQTRSRTCGQRGASIRSTRAQMHAHCYTDRVTTAPPPSPSRG